MEEQNGRKIKIINNLGLSAEFSPIGASIRSLKLNGKPLLLEAKEDSVFEKSPFFCSKVLGRVAGRIPNVVDLGDKVYRFPETEPGDCLHGGLMDSLSFVRFEVYIANQPEGNYVIFTYTSPDGDCGFPGNLDIKVTYFMPINRNEITVRLKAIGDADTPVNLSLHPYFNLEGTENIDDQLLCIHGSRYGHHKPGCNLIDSIEPIPQYLDFTKPVKVGERIAQIASADKDMNTLDHLFLFDTIQSEKPQVTLQARHLRLEILTDYEGVNVYADGNTKDSADYVNNPNLKLHRALAIEPELSNVPFENLMLKAGQKYSKFMTFRFLETEGE